MLSSCHIYNANLFSYAQDTSKKRITATAILLRTQLEGDQLPLNIIEERRAEMEGRFAMDPVYYSVP